MAENTTHVDPAIDSDESHLIEVERSSLTEQIESIGISEKEYYEIRDKLDFKAVEESMDKDILRLNDEIKTMCQKIESKYGDSFKLHYNIIQSPIFGFKLCLYLIKDYVQDNPRKPSLFFHP